MNKVIIRSLLIAFGLIFLLGGGYFLIMNLSQVGENFISSGFSEVENPFDILSISLLFFGFILFFIGKNWDHAFKTISVSLISTSILFFAAGTMLFSVDSNIEEIVDSIQPSFDQIIVQSLDEVLLSQIPQPENDILRIAYSNETDIERYYIKNITYVQAQKFLDALGITDLDDEEKIAFTKFYLDMTYQNIESTNPSLLSSPLPIHLLKEEIENGEFDFSVVTSAFDPDIINQIEIEDEVFLNILFSSDIQTKNIEINNLSNEDVNLIWNNLKFSGDVSIETKKKYLQILFSMYSQVSENLNHDQIPLNLISNYIPENMSDLFNYDLFSSNHSYSAQELANLRSDCENNSISFSEICEPILMTKYENLLTLASNASLQNQTGMNLNSFIEKIDTKEKINELIELKSSIWPYFYLISLFLLTLSMLTYYLHFRLFERELILMHIPYYIFKINFFHALLNFLFFSIIFYLIASQIAFELVSSYLDIDLSIIGNLYELEIISTFIDILWLFFYINLSYVIFNLALYAASYFLLKKEVDKIY